MGPCLRWERAFCIPCSPLEEQRCLLISIRKKGSDKAYSKWYLSLLTAVLPKHIFPWDPFFVHPTHYHPGAHHPNRKVQNLRLAFGARPTDFIGQPLSSPATSPLHILHVLLLQGMAHSCLHLLEPPVPLNTQRPLFPPHTHCWLLLPTLSILEYPWMPVLSPSSFPGHSLLLSELPL